MALTNRLLGQKFSPQQRQNNANVRSNPREKAAIRGDQRVLHIYQWVLRSAHDSNPACERAGTTGHKRYIGTRRKFVVNLGLNRLVENCKYQSVRAY